MLDRWQSMAVFVAIVEEGSLTAAAERFGLSRPMVGKHLAELESRLGTRLLVRTTRRQVLTEAGQQFHLRCKQLLSEVEEAEDEARSAGGRIRGRVRITAPVTYGSLHLAPALQGFMAQYPDLSVQLDASDRRVDVVGEGFDAAIRIGPVLDTTLVARPLAPYRVILCAAPSYLARKGVPRTLADLADHDVPGLTAWQTGAGWTLGEDITLPPGRFECNNGLALKALAMAGGGIVMQPAVLLADAMASGALVEILQGQGPLPKPVHLLYRQDRLERARTRALIDWIVAAFGEARSAVITR